MPDTTKELTEEIFKTITEARETDHKLNADKFAQLEKASADKTSAHL